MRPAGSVHAGLDEKAEECTERAIAAFGEAGNCVGRIRATTVPAHNYSDTGSAQLGRPRLRDTIDASAGSTRAHADATAQFARGSMLDQHTDEALEWCDRALAVAEELDDVPVIIQAQTTKGVVLGGRAARTRSSSWPTVRPRRM